MAGPRGPVPRLFARCYRVTRVPRRIRRGGVETEVERLEITDELVPYVWSPRWQPPAGLYTKRRLALAAISAQGARETVTGSVDQWAEAARQIAEKRACRRSDSAEGRLERNRRLQQEQRDHLAGLKEQARADRAAGRLERRLSSPGV